MSVSAGSSGVGGQHDAGMLDAGAGSGGAGTGGGDAGDAGDAGPSGDAGPITTVTKPDGTTPSNFSCNHHFTDPPAEASAPHAFAVSIVVNSSTPFAATGGTLALIDPSTGSTTGMPSTTIDATGAATLALAGNTRAAWKVSAEEIRCDPCVDSYEWNRLVGPDATATTTPLATMAFEIDHFVGTSEASGFLAHQYLLGTVLDCDGDPVMNASISVGSATACPSSGASGQDVCFTYQLGNGSPSPVGGTSSVGQFIVFTQAPSAVSVQVMGRLSPSDTSLSVLGTLDAMTFAGSLSLGTTSPLRN